MSRDGSLERIYREQDEDPVFNHLKLEYGGVAHQLVPGDGRFSPRLIIIGEAPGRKEDILGMPFVGPSGKFLDELLEIASLRREEVWITNVVKFRPPRNRDPEQTEIKASLAYLRRELALVGANGCRNIVGLGRTACSALAGEPISPTAKHGSWRPLQGSWKLFISCHPAWGLRNPLDADRMRNDFLQLGYDLDTDNKEPAAADFHQEGDRV